MSDASQGPGWWQASDGKWYPPEQAPGTGRWLQQPAAVVVAAAGHLDVGAALSYGWNKFVQYIGQIIVIFLIIFGVQIVFNIFGSSSAAASAASLLVLSSSSAGRLDRLLHAAAGLVRAALAITEGRARAGDAVLRPTTSGRTLSPRSSWPAAASSAFRLCVGDLGDLPLHLLLWVLRRRQERQRPTELDGSASPWSRTTPARSPASP